MTSNYNDFLYGLCGGFTGTLVSHPFDTIKTRIQSKKAPDIKSALMMRNLYAGLTPPLLGIMLEKSIVFGFYNKAKEHGINDFWSGIIGGFMCTLIVTPIDQLKIQMQNTKTVQGKLNTSLLGCSNVPIPIQNLVIAHPNQSIKKFHYGVGYVECKQSKLSIRTMYRGFIPTVCRETPGFGIYFTVYNHLTSNYNNTNMSNVKTFSFGALSGLAAWTFIYPSDLVKTKMQSSENISIQKIIGDIFSENNPRSSIIGMRNFYKGFSLAIMRAMPLHGGVFLGYELSKRYI